MITVTIDLKEYAEYVFADLKRNPLFFTEADNNKFQRIVQEYWSDLIQKRAS